MREAVLRLVGASEKLVSTSRARKEAIRMRLNHRKNRSLTVAARQRWIHLPGFSEAPVGYLGELFGRPRHRWWMVLLGLLVASNVTQLVWPGLPLWGDPPNQRTVWVRRMLDSGSEKASSQHPEDVKPVRLSYRQWGDQNSQSTVLLLPGSPSFGSTFDDLGPMLAKRTDGRVISLDFPGYGQSSDWVPDYGIKANARYALALMDQLGIDHAQVFGYSMGGGAALWMANLAPRRIDALSLYGGLGVMKDVTSGNETFEQFKYALGYGIYVVGVEALPHFGLAGRRSFRHALMRGFLDSDLRPMGSVLEMIDKQNTPLLLLQGAHDSIVPADTARTSHQIVTNSQLVMMDRGHFAVFNKAGSKALAEHLGPFIKRFESPNAQPRRQTTDPFKSGGRPESPLPFGWDLRRSMSPWTQMGVIIVGTYILEDPMTVFTGLMVSAGQVDLFVALIGLFIGIFTGDLGLYLIGWIGGRRALRWGPLRKRLPTRHIERLGAWFDRHGWSAILASRFIPGTRLPLYISAGALGRKPGRFAAWTCMAVAIWAVVMLFAVVILGKSATGWLEQAVGNKWLALILALVIILGVIRTTLLLTTRTGRSRLRAAITKIWRWEFWPVWFFYLPVLGYIAYLALRHGGLKTITAVNPAIPASGFVDESKIDILHQLPEAWIIPSALVRDMDEMRQVMGRRGWSLPLILKPDAGQRGYGLRKIDDQDELAEYFQTAPPRVLAQTYHPGPYEAGVFYYRLPGTHWDEQGSGHIFSITDKWFPVIEGDGEHTLEQLIHRHPRFSMQAQTFLKRFGDERDRVLAKGQRMSLAVAGNHCQGVEFRDGSHLITPQLERRIDRIAGQLPGFHFGRFDIRYQSADQLKAGRCFAIIELNGVTSESTNIYDPAFSLFDAYRTLFGQWKLAFRIGQANRRQGTPTTPLSTLLNLLRTHRRTRRRAQALAD